LRTQPPTVAAVVERHDVVGPTERLVAREPVQIRRRRPAVQQHDSRGAGWPGQLANVQGATVGALEVATRWEVGPGDVGAGLDRLAQADSTFSTRTVIGPVGASYVSVAPGAPDSTRVPPSGD